MGIEKEGNYLRKLIGLGDEGLKVRGSSGKNCTMAGKEVALETNLFWEKDLRKKKLLLTSQQSDKLVLSSRVERRVVGLVADFTVAIAANKIKSETNKTFQTIAEKNFLFALLTGEN